MAVISSSALKDLVSSKFRALVSNNNDHFTDKELLAYQALAEAIVEHLSGKDVTVTGITATCPSGGGPLVFTSGTGTITAGS